jgi:hypothetical protein
LLDPSILKTGRNVDGDFRKVMRDYCPDLDCSGPIDGLCELGAMAKKANIVESGSASLDSISQAVLSYRLDKTDWNAEREQRNKFTVDINCLFVYN